MPKIDMIGFDDLFDFKDIEKTFEQTLEADIVKVMNKWEQEKKEKDTHESFGKKSEQEQLIENIVRNVIREEIDKMARGSGLFGERFCKALQYQGIERNCPTCIYHAHKDYGTLNCN